MGLARDLVQLEVNLRQDEKLNIFSSAKQGGLFDNAEFQTVLTKLASPNFSTPAHLLRLCLQALRVQHEELKPQLLDAELVATIPADSPGIARPTERVVREMLDKSVHEIIVLGYEFTDKEMVRLIADASSRGVETLMICDRARGTAERIVGAWPQGIRLPRLFHDKARSEAGPYASMHAKCLLVDGNNLLITSANFTFHGMRENIEIGMRLSGWPAQEARKVFSYLVENGLVVECSA